MTIATKRGPVIIAADGMGQTEIIQLAYKLCDLKLRAVKYNDALDYPGPQIMRAVEAETGVSSFADAKLCDIPATVENRARKLVKAGASIITVKADSGEKGIAAAVAGVTDTETGAMHAAIYVVGVLTSMNEDECLFHYRRTVAEQQRAFFLMAREGGAHGLICSPKDLPLAKNIGWTGDIATPGVRSPGAEAHDQVRIDTPKAAIAGDAMSIKAICQAIETKKYYDLLGWNTGSDWDN